MSRRRCLLCGAWFEKKSRGRAQVFCSGRCRTRAYRQRLISVPVIPETGTPVSFDSMSEASTFLHADDEMMDYAAEVVCRADGIVAANRALVEASDGVRSVWRYCDDDEDDVLEAAEGYRTYTDIDFWVDWD